MDVRIIEVDAGVSKRYTIHYYSGEMLKRPARSLGAARVSVMR